MEKEMEQYMYHLVYETNAEIRECRMLFLSRFPGQERFWDTQIYDWLD